MNAQEAVSLALHLSVLCRPIGLGVGEALEPDDENFWLIDAGDLESTPMTHAVSPKDLLAKWEVLTLDHLKEEYRKASGAPW